MPRKRNAMALRRWLRKSLPRWVENARRARRLHTSGLTANDIARMLGVHPLQVEKWISTIDCGEAAELHRAAWQQPFPTGEPR